jgi:hypothetical protein
MPQIIRGCNYFKAQGCWTAARAMRHDAPATVARSAESRQLPVSVAIDNTAETVERFGNVKIFPITLAIDRHGKLVKHFVGAPDFGALHDLTNRLPAEGEARSPILTRALHSLLPMHQANAWPRRTQQQVETILTATSKPFTWRSRSVSHGVPLEEGARA